MISNPLTEGLALISPVYCQTSSTYQKHLKLGHSLEVDDRRSLSKFGKSLRYRSEIVRVNFLC